MNNCKGCIDMGRCEFGKLADTLKCPCRMCLVKTMCYSDVCDDFKLFVERIFNKRREDE